MGDSAKDKGDEELSFGALVTLSVMVPGMGQLANGQRGKGIITIVISSILAIDIVVHAFLLGAMLYGGVDSLSPTDRQNLLIDPLKSLAIICLLAVAIWAWALVDTIIVARKKADRAKPAG